MKIVIVGPAGSGKGTQSELISKKYRVPQISMGDLLRDFAKGGSKKAKETKKLLEKGILVPDELTVRLIRKRIKKEDCRKGFILDGWPRNMNQVRLAKFLKIDHVIYLDVRTSELIKRLSSRWSCPKCKAVYGSAKREKRKGLCDKCGSVLFQREDDKPAAIRERLKVFRKYTRPMIAYYKKQGVLRRINGNRPPEEILGDIEKALG